MGRRMLAAFYKYPIGGAGSHVRMGGKLLVVIVVVVAVEVSISNSSSNRGSNGSEVAIAVVAFTIFLHQCLEAPDFFKILLWYTHYLISFVLFLPSLFSVRKPKGAEEEKALSSETVSLPIYLNENRTVLIDHVDVPKPTNVSTVQKYLKALILKMHGELFNAISKNLVVFSSLDLYPRCSVSADDIFIIFFILQLPDFVLGQRGAALIAWSS